MAADERPDPATGQMFERNSFTGPKYLSWDARLSKMFRFGGSKYLEVLFEMFNITNRLNYENPAAALPAGTVGQPFTDAVAGTFGYMLGPLNRTVGLGTARQTQVSVRFLF